MDEIDEKKEKMIGWMINPLMALSGEISELMDYTNLVSGSLSILASDNTVEKITTDVYNDSGDTRDKVIKLHQQAKKEKGDGYPNLAKQYIVILFSYLDNGIRDFVTSAFKHYPGAMDIKEVAEIKISVSEFRKKNGDEIAHYLYQEYERKVTKDEYYGVNRFEKLLSPLGFGGNVSKELITTILELARLRNIIVHNGGKADAAIIKMCPQLHLQLDEKVSISIEQLNKYVLGVIAYLKLIIQRVHKRIEDEGFSLLMSH